MSIFYQNYIYISINNARYAHIYFNNALYPHYSPWRLRGKKSGFAMALNGRRELGKWVGGGKPIALWRSDIPPPRGPSLAIRPTPEHCRIWLEEAGFRSIQAVDLHNCCPYHFRLLAYADKAGKL
jgi:hypothetical protein